MADWRLTYRGASFPAEMRIVDVNIGAPAIDVTSIEPATRAGGIFARRTVRGRSITVTFVLMENDPEKRMTLLKQVNSLLTSNAEVELTMGVNGARIMCTCTKLPDVSAAQFWEVLSFELYANDPYFYTTKTLSKTLAYTSNIIKLTDTNATNLAWKIIMNQYTGQDEISWTINGQTVTLAPLGSSGKLVIDGTAKTIKLGNNSVMSMMSLGSRFYDGDLSSVQVQTVQWGGGIGPGNEQTWTETYRQITISTTASGIGSVFQYNERWL